MISREELDMIVAGCVNQAANAIESVGGNRLTRTETDRMGMVIQTAIRLVADRCHTMEKLPPPPPAARERRPTKWFDPLKTTELPRVTPEDVERARGQK
jgi:hypothetical protein